MDEPHTSYRAPFWLRGLILAVVLWLGVRIVGNVTDALTGMVEGRASVPAQMTERGG